MDKETAEASSNQFRLKTCSLKNSVLDSSDYWAFRVLDFKFYLIRLDQGSEEKSSFSNSGLDCLTQENL